MISALFPAAQPPLNTPFTVYTNEKEKSSSSRAVIAAETESMEWDSRNHLGIEMGGGDGEVAGEGPGYSVQSAPLYPF